MLKQRPPSWHWSAMLWHIEPCLPTPSKRVPVGPQWVHEIKHDGYRLLVRRQGARVRVFTRRGYDWSHRFPLIVEAIARLRVSSIFIDGEGVVCGDDGVSDFDKLHSQGWDEHVFLYAFDLLEHDGVDYRDEPLENRKGRLAKLLATADPGVRFNEHIELDGAIVFEHACKLGLEGIVSKRRGFPYRSGERRAGSRSRTRIAMPPAPRVTQLTPCVFSPRTSS
jgi:bifunctional non-homologous end joining protein LigD